MSDANKKRTNEAARKFVAEIMRAKSAYKNASTPEEKEKAKRHILELQKQSHTFQHNQVADGYFAKK